VCCSPRALRLGEFQVFGLTWIARCSRLLCSTALSPPLQKRKSLITAPPLFDTLCCPEQADDLRVRQRPATVKEPCAAHSARAYTFWMHGGEYTQQFVRCSHV